MTPPRTHYEVLQVSESASPEVIRAAWAALQRTYHPDRPVPEGMTVDQQRLMCQLVNEAYETLSDPTRKAAYDQALNANRRPVEMPRGDFSGFDASAYPQAYNSPMEFAQAAVRDAATAAGTVFVENLFQNLPPELRHVAQHLYNKRRAG